MKSVAFLSLLSLAAATVLERDTSCPAPSSTITSTITVAAAAVATGAALSVCSGEPVTVTSTVTVSGAAAVATAATSAPAAAATGATGTTGGVNVQLFTGTLGGPPPPVISSAGTRPFTVKGDTFVGSGAAIGRSCDIQHNACANAANSGSVAGGVSQCDAQDAACRSFNNLR